MDATRDFEQFVGAAQRRLLRTAWLLVGDWAKAEDLVQTSLLRAWPHWKRLDGMSDRDAYVRRIMVNQAISWRRRRWSREAPTLVLPEVVEPDFTDQVDLHQLVISTLRTLPPRQRAVLVLRFFDDLTEAQSAWVMGCSVGTVKSQTSRALAALRRHPELAGLQLKLQEDVS